VPICLFDYEIREELLSNRLISGGPCQLSHGKNFVIDYNGDVVPCTHMTGFPMANIFTNNGVFSKKEFLETYNSKDEIPFKFREKLNRAASKKCNSPNCDQPCSGGCPLIWTFFNPDKEIKGVTIQSQANRASI
jgi:radical SAM protein with 4Fe4S-binding SPASM domain